MKLVVKADGATMVPVDIDSTTVEQQLQALHYNIERFDHDSFETWLTTQSDAVQQLAKSTPPDQVYILHGDDGQQAYCYIEGYANGAPPVAVVRILGWPDGSPIGVPGDALAPLPLPNLV